MSIFGKIGHAVKSGVHAVGKVAEKAAPIVGLIPGVGTLAAGAIGGLGGLAAGDGWKGALKYGAEGALGDIGAGLLGKIPGVGGVMKSVGLNAPTFGGGISALGHTLGIGGGGGSGAAPTVPSAGTDMITLPNGVRIPASLTMSPQGVASLARGQGGGGGIISGIGKFLGGNSLGGGGKNGTPNWQTLLGLGLGGAGVIQNAQQSSQARGLTDQQIKDAQAARARQQAIQDQVLAALKGPGPAAPDYTSIFAQTQNPFYRPQATQMESRS